MALRLLSQATYRMYGNAPTQSVGALRIASLSIFRLDVLDNGVGVISGVTTVENVPRSRRVRLFDKQSGRLVRETFSTDTGQYSFANINPNLEYFLVAHDHLRVYNAVVQDMIKP